MALLLPICYVRSSVFYFYGSCVRLLEHAAFILRHYLVYIDMIPGIRRHHFTYLILYSFVTAVGRCVLINSYNRTSDTSICDGIALVLQEAPPINIKS